MGDLVRNAQDRENLRRIAGRIKLSIVERLGDGDDKGLASELATISKLEEELDAEQEFEELRELTRGKL